MGEQIQLPRTTVFYAFSAFVVGTPNSMVGISHLFEQGPFNESSAGEYNLWMMYGDTF